MREKLSSDKLCGMQVPFSDDVVTFTMDRFDEDEWESLLLYYHQTVRPRPAKSEVDPIQFIQGVALFCCYPVQLDLVRLYVLEFRKSLFGSNCRHPPGLLPAHANAEAVWLLCWSCQISNTIHARLPG